MSTELIAAASGATNAGAALILSLCQMWFPEETEQAAEDSHTTQSANVAGRIHAHTWAHKTYFSSSSFTHTKKNHLYPESHYNPTLII